jgi:FlaG/FlaF family flagellin (archaellin)
VRGRKGMGGFVRGLLRDKRAITPILSSLLLTVIAVGAMAIATSATFVITTNMKETMSERIVAEDVWFNPATHTIDVYLSNVGKVNVHVSNVYVNHTSQPFNTPFNLELDGHRWLVIVYSWNSGNLYYVDIVTNRGTHIASQYRAP